MGHSEWIRTDPFTALAMIAPANLAMFTIIGGTQHWLDTANAMLVIVCVFVYYHIDYNDKRYEAEKKKYTFSFSSLSK